ncbi:MAG: RluA family pseudouridine synthase [Hyphomicrobiales bacterium]|nr:RluA family pseudouridine synthase [Hyphomicrobiales bacterium]
MSGVEIREVAAGDDGIRIDRWFKVHYPGLSFGRLQKLMRTGQIRLDGGRTKPGERIAAGQKIRVPPIDPEAAPKPKRRPSDKDTAFVRSLILHEDKDLIVLNKPYGLAVQGGSGTTRHLDGMLGALAGRGGEPPRLVHRLDRDTAGVIVLARRRAVAAELSRTFRSRSARKIYWALVTGVPKPAQGRISVALAKTPGPQGERVAPVDPDDEDAQHAVTYYSVIDKAAQRFAWLSLKPVTGRTHQLRVHCAHIGHPIVGDPKYGERHVADPERDPLGGLDNKLHLVARRIVLPHPAGGTLDVTAPLPEHMQRSWDRLGFDVADYDPKVEEDVR